MSAASSIRLRASNKRALPSPLPCCRCPQPIEPGVRCRSGDWQGPLRSALGFRVCGLSRWSANSSRRQDYRPTRHMFWPSLPVDSSRHIFGAGVQRRVATIKLADVMPLAQLLDFEFRRGGLIHDRRLATCDSVNKRRSRGLSFGGRSRAAMNAFHCFSPSTNRVWSDKVCSARSRALRRTKSVTFTPWRSAVTLMRVSSEAVAARWNEVPGLFGS